MSGFSKKSGESDDKTKVAKSHIKPTKKSGGGGGGSGKSKKDNILDDGSMYNDPSAMDERDPNYDSEEETGREYIPVVSTRVPSYDPELRSSVKTASMKLPEYKKAVEKYLEEYFSSSDAEEWKRLVSELACPEYSYELVKRAISMSLDRGDRERELVSQLFSVSYPDILSASMIGKGFERLFELADELEKDVPSARDNISTFLARCVVDEVLPPSFLSDIVVCNLGGDIVDHCKRMLSREHAGAQLERIWGPGDGRPVKEMKVAVDLLIQEYVLSGDVDEASRCIKELSASYFHHEVVKRGVSQVLDKSEDSQLQLSRLFTHLSANEIISAEQFSKGFARIYESMSDLSLDIPNARPLTDAIKARAIADKVLPEDTA
mmetsp:Transcript_31497/g.58649  ORF Transcript_31497/g.58649 Transcript_31497/m.58649 type:complete len:378 (+) Transcript_31497:90-1223(+)|eukprot:CAMPEP_0114428706 /NCGR_PEP_ID=MMETSP0103-20121206/9079_1 /TAXON_ID=37642 ORGANISM="Paraphysomonas imperforata, Strain PA2" /NCGR_SAMPLE_ID=MMETSP0103 /ASSEMBLY_ACC=CAM_ASM_000201 /LENGTH=377 /DNA_ID=CAMNT_0001597961 /DNA_START=90 /DNA_END=1223 /DNA_ORIENTATION=+